MPLEDDLRIIANRLPEVRNHLETEEATKNALIMPFIRALGYDVFDPTEVIPEFTADVGNRSGEKVDYAIVHDGAPVILFECKAAGIPLNDQHLNQLTRYFTTTPARIGVLTNGISYRFYADLVRLNMMDTKPFLEIDMENLDDAALSELGKFSKGIFDVASTLAAASEMKYIKEIKQILSQQLRAPDEEFVSFITGRIYSGRRTQPVIERFTQITKVAFNQLINDRVQNRLRSAISLGESPVEEPPAAETGTKIQPPLAAPQFSPVSDWKRFSDFEATLGAAPPSAIRFPTGKEESIRNWRHLVEITLSWLWENQILKLSDLPIASSKKRYLASATPIHPTGRPYKPACQVPGTPLYIDGNINSKVSVSNAKKALQRCGQDPALVLLKVE